MRRYLGPLIFGSALVLGSGNAFASDDPDGPTPPTRTDQGASYTLLGKTFCFGDVARVVACDFRMPPAPRPDRPPAVVTLFGKSLCFGDPPLGTRCDARFPTRDTTAERLELRKEGWLQSLKERLPSTDDSGTTPRSY